MKDRKVGRRVRWSCVLFCSGLLSVGCAHVSASGGCGSDAVTVDGRAVVRHNCGDPLGTATGVATSARVGQTLKVHLPDVAGARMQSSDPLTLVPAGDGSFRAGMPGYASVFILAKPGERCIQPPRSCNLFNVHVVR